MNEITSLIKELLTMVRSEAYIHLSGQAILSVLVVGFFIANAVHILKSFKNI